MLKDDEMFRRPLRLAFNPSVYDPQCRHKPVKSDQRDSIGPNEVAKDRIHQRDRAFERNGRCAEGSYIPIDLV